MDMKLKMKGNQTGSERDFGRILSIMSIWISGVGRVIPNEQIQNERRIRDNPP